MNLYLERLGQLRRLMEEKGWDAVVLTGSDPHASEYPAARWKQVEWLTGFSGECGDVAVTRDHAGLWTDTRYFIQASKVLPGTGFVLHKTRVPGAVLIPEWLSREAFPEPSGKVVVAVDGLSESMNFVESVRKAFSIRNPDDGEVKIVNVPDLMDRLWTDRPGIPESPILTLGEDLTGESRASKLSWLRNFISGNGCGAILVTALDEIAWLLNVRGSDILYNPYVMSYLILTMDKAIWCVKKNSFRRPDEETRDSFMELKADGIEVREYDDIELVLMEIAEEAGRIYADPATLNYALHLAMDSSGAEILLGPSPVPLRKAVKNEVEIEGMKEAHLQDGAAMERFFYWLERQLDAGSAITERDVADKLGEFRSMIDGYMGDSFETISAYGQGAALPHYVTPKEDAPLLDSRGLYLCDSGGQYMYGTTDITRTVPLGRCTALEKEDYTLVLKGHIGLARVVFPYGTSGSQIDLAARAPLWEHKRDFGHGTGHGVGFFLGVHEGPQEIRHDHNSVPFEAGMITSDEPGIYREGLHGVRHENLLLCKDLGTNDFGRWLGFEPLTLCHFDTSALLPELLSSEEREWLNSYNTLVYDSLAPILPEAVKVWLKVKTKSI